jgi:mono/diheme cytochrome c family protein
MTPMPSTTSITGSQERERDPGWLAPVEAAAKPNPLANRPGAEAGGQKVFRQRCATCHGDDGRGTRKAPDLTQADVQMQTDGALFWKISGGNSHQGMPAFSFLPEPQRWQLVLHLRAIATPSGGHSTSRDPAGTALSDVAVPARHCCSRARQSTSNAR